MGKTEKTGKKIMQLKWPKYKKPKDENMGWTKHKPYKEDLDIVFCVYVKGHLTRKQTHMWHLPRNSIAASEAYYLSTFLST